MKNVRIIRVNKGEEVEGAAKVAEVYNNLPADTHAGRATITGSGEDVVFTIHITDAPGSHRTATKKVTIIRAAKGEEEAAAKKIAEIYSSLEPHEVASKTIAVSAGEDMVYVIFSDVYPETDEDENLDDDDLDEDENEEETVDDCADLVLADDLDTLRAESEPDEDEDDEGFIPFG